MKAFLAVLFTISIIQIGQAQNWIQKGLNIDGEAGSDESGYSVSLSSDANTVAIGAPWNDGNGTDAGHVRIYRWNSHVWVQQGLDIDGEAADDHFGNSVSLCSDGYTVAIGAPCNDGNNGLYTANAGHTRVYFWNNTSWIQKGFDINGEYYNDESGCSVSIDSDGSAVAIGARRNNDNGVHSGQTRVYEYDINTSVKELYDNETIVFPNPNTGVFSLMNLNSGAQIRIYNSMGQLVYEAEIIEDNQNFDLSNYKKGLYILYGVSDQHIKVLVFIIE